MPSPRMPERPPLPPSTTRRRSIRPVLYATRLFTVRIPTSSSLSHKEEAMRQGKNPRSLQSDQPISSRRLLIDCRIALLFLFVLLPGARAQQPEEQKGIDQGNYNIKQSIEFGGRITSISGNENVYDTFVDLQPGARLLGFTTEMRSLDHHATMFDRLYSSSFGYGGDPNEVSRLRISKNKWYGF